MKIENILQPRPDDFCLVCGAHPNVIGIFVPDNPSMWGAPEGKTRLVRYCLCQRCNQKKDTPDNVEKILMAELIGGVTNAE